MLPIPAQRRPPCSRRRERYPSAALMEAAATVHALLGWEVVAARRLEDGAVEATYVRAPGLTGPEAGDEST